MHIDIVSDVICPWCFIGKRRLEQALLRAPQADLRILWHPFQLNPDMPPEGMERGAYLRAKFGDAGGGVRMNQVEAAGAEAGIDFAFERIRRTPNTLAAHRLIRWAASMPPGQDPMVETLFRAYFRDGADLGDAATLAALAALAGFDAAAAAAHLAGDDGRAETLAADSFARSIGITGVPCFIIERKFALSGAQDPEAFLEVFAAARAEMEAPTPDLV